MVNVSNVLQFGYVFGSYVRLLFSGPYTTELPVCVKILTSSNLIYFMYFNMSFNATEIDMCISIYEYTTLKMGNTLI